VILKDRPFRGASKSPCSVYRISHRGDRPEHACGQIFSNKALQSQLLDVSSSAMLGRLKIGTAEGYPRRTRICAVVLSATAPF
jgi:hypothetical protein